MKIAFIGTACVGKTTVIQYLKENIEKFKLLENHQFLGSMTAKAQENGYDLNEFSSETTQSYLYELYKENSLIQNTIEDRCIFDNICYSIFLYDFLKKEISIDFIIKCVEELPSILGRYDYIFYLPVEIPLVNEYKESRTKNEIHRNVVDDIFKNLIKTFSNENNINIIELNGNIEEKIKKLELIFKEDS